MGYAGELSFYFYDFSIDLTFPNKYKNLEKQMGLPSTDK